MKYPTLLNQRHPERPGGHSEAIPGSSAMAGGLARSAVERLLSPGDVARLLQVPRSWVYERTRERSQDRLPGFRLGKYWRFRSSDVLAWLERQRQGGEV
jgi:excisionase family DNA binding protein